MMTSNQKFVPYKKQVPKRSPKLIIKPDINTLSTQNKIEEVLKELKSNNPDQKRIQNIQENICQHISKTNNLEILISDDDFFELFQLCYQNKEILPECWQFCESKIIKFLNDPRLCGFLNSPSKREKLLTSFPTEAIKKAFKN